VIARRRRAGLAPNGIDWQRVRIRRKQWAQAHAPHRLRLASDLLQARLPDKVQRGRADVAAARLAPTKVASGCPPAGYARPASSSARVRLRMHGGPPLAPAYLLRLSLSRPRKIGTTQASKGHWFPDAVRRPFRPRAVWRRAIPEAPDFSKFGRPLSQNPPNETKTARARRERARLVVIP